MDTPLTGEATLPVSLLPPFQWRSALAPVSAKSFLLVGILFKQTKNMKLQKLSPFIKKIGKKEVHPICLKDIDTPHCNCPSDAVLLRDYNINP